MMTIKLSEHPDVRDIIRATDPAYRKTSAYVHVTDKVTVSGTYWDGGSRDTYTAVNLSTRRAISAPQFDPPQFGGPQAAPTVTLPAGVAIVRTGVFCGRAATATVYVRAADVAPLLPSR
jgi:hypothetical protein